MRCPYCGGYHYGHGTPPPVNYTVPNAMNVDEARISLQAAMRAVEEEAEARKDPYERDVLPKGDGRLWEPRVYGTDERGEEVTVAFGKDGTTHQHHAMISDSHVTGWRFYEPDDVGVKGHDHIGPGPSKDKLRGRYTGYEGFHDPDE